MQFLPPTINVVPRGCWLFSSWANAIVADVEFNDSCIGVNVTGTAYIGVESTFGCQSILR